MCDGRRGSAVATVPAYVARPRWERRPAWRRQEPAGAPAGRPGSYCRWQQYVSSATQRVNHRRAVGVDLLAEIGDVELDDVRLATEVVVPDAVQDLGLAEHSLRVAHQVAEQFELGRGELDLDAATAYLVAVLVEREIADNQGRVAPGQCGTAAA